MIYINRFDKLGLRLLGGLFAAILLPWVARADTNRIILQENFESFRTTKALRAAWSGGSAELVTNAPGGGRCASHDGVGMNRRGGFFLFPDATHHIVFEADLYDFGTNTEKNVTVTLNAEEGHENVVMGLKAPHGYMARAGGLSDKTNSIPFKRGLLPIKGWHHFKGVVTATNFIATVDFGRDGNVDYTIEIPFNKPAPTFTQLRFGGYSGKLAAGGMVLVDNLRLEVVAVEPVASIAPVASTLTNQTVTATVAESQNAPKLSSNETAQPVAVALRTNASRSMASNAAAVAASSVAQSSNPDATSMSAPNRPAESAGASTAATNLSLPMAIYWIGGALGLIIMLLAVLILMVRRHSTRNPRALLVDEFHASAAASEALALKDNGDGHWRDRALQAEAIAAKQAQILKDKVGPELVQFARETLVQGLYNQRNALLETQAQARQTLTELENRLSELKLPSQERIAVYEKRIAELEKQLGSRNDEMRELTRATLLMIQEKLVEERQGQRFN